MATSPVAPFSGGEKARLVLAMIVYQKPNLLLLDEPTNHLDLDMRHALSIALQEFEGAMIVVSHDRHLLRTVTDSLLLVADGKVTPFDGDLDDYRQWVKDREREIKTTGDEVVNPVKDNPSMVSTSKKQQRQNAAELRKKLQPLRNKIKTLETQIEKFNQEKTAIQEQLADSRIYEEQNKTKLKQLLEEQALVDKQLQQLEELWLAANEELEALENE
jgi:ATP-binding cassette subfamily F protein 3